MKDDVKKRAARRTKIMEGQIRGLQAMIEKEAYCMDILTQSLAIQKSLQSLSKMMVEHHIGTHVTHMLASGRADQQTKALQELVTLYELNNIRGK